MSSRALSLVGLIIVLALAACESALPGFANPPPYDAGVDAGADDDAGEDG